MEEGYEALLKGFAAREEGLKAREEEAAELAESRSTELPLGRDQRVKRKFTVEEDEDEEDDRDGSEDDASKRPKL